MLAILFWFPMVLDKMGPILFKNRTPLGNCMPLENQTVGYHWNSKRVWYSSPHCNLTPDLNHSCFQVASSSGILSASKVSRRSEAKLQRPHSLHWQCSSGQSGAYLTIPESYHVVLHNNLVAFPSKSIYVTSFSSIPYCRISEIVLIFKRIKDTQSRDKMSMLDL